MLSSHLTQTGNEWDVTIAFDDLLPHAPITVEEKGDSSSCTPTHTSISQQQTWMPLPNAEQTQHIHSLARSVPLVGTGAEPALVVRSADSPDCDQSLQSSIQSSQIVNEFRLITPPDTPDPVTQPKRISRAATVPTSHYSDKEVTPPCIVSYLAALPHTRHSDISQWDYSEKEVVETPHSFTYHHPAFSRSTRLSTKPSNWSLGGSSVSSLSPSGFGSPLAYTDSSLAYTDTTLAFTEDNHRQLTTYPAHEMDFFRRRKSQALRVAPPHRRSGNESDPHQTPQEAHSESSSPWNNRNRHTQTSYSSVSIAETLPSCDSSTLVAASTDKLSVGPQDTGIVHGQGDVGFGYGVQDEEKQSVNPYDRSITAQISLSRSTRVRAVVDAYVEPIIREQAFGGLSATTLVLVPEVAVNPNSSNALGKSNPFDLSLSTGASENKVKKLDEDVCRLLTREEASDLLIGFPTELSLRVVRLSPAHSGHTGHSGDNRNLYGDEGSRFWQQPAVVAELDRLLRIRLVDMGLDVQDLAGATLGHRRSGWMERGEMVGGELPAGLDLENRRRNEQRKGGITGRSFIGGGISGGGSGGGGSSSNGGTWHGSSWDAGIGIWTSSGRDRQASSWQRKEKSRLMPGQASVVVELQDVCFRTQNAMGLYETRTDQAVVVAIDIEV